MQNIVQILPGLHWRGVKTFPVSLSVKTVSQLQSCRQRAVGTPGHCVSHSSLFETHSLAARQLGQSTTKKEGQEQ